MSEMVWNETWDSNYSPKLYRTRDSGVVLGFCLGFFLFFFLYFVNLGLARKAQLPCVSSVLASAFTSTPALPPDLVE